MKYRINKDNLSLVERICNINNVDINNLDVSNFEVDYNQEIINEFKNKLLSNSDKRFFIVGDYDCDGICATTIIKRLLESLNIECNYYIPSRFKQGYGLNKDIVKIASDNNFGALLCVDNGAVAYEQLEYAKELGLKTFVIDHHEYEKQVDVDAFLHPNLFNENYSDMCAAGLCALLANSFKEDSINIVYGGLATLADMVTVLNYNRFLLKRMIDILNSEDVLPIKYLLGNNPVSYESLSYNVIPKINAVSRLEDMMNVNYVVRYLSENNQECLKYLNKIEEINTTRKDLTRQMSSLAERLIDHNEEFIVLKSDVFAEGLCGLIANKILSEYGKPVLVLNKNNNELKGSGRSPDGFDIFSYLSKTKELFSAFGGHNQAVGLSMDYENYDKLIDFIHSNNFEVEEKEKDALYLEINDIDESVINDIEELAPYGHGFEKPLLCIDGTYSSSFNIKGMYPKFILNDKLEAISFNSSHINKDFKMMIGHLRKDDYHRNKLSFLIEDLI